jgi:pimeloyl-ACP methyl ester carboxylesterase
LEKRLKTHHAQGIDFFYSLLSDAALPREYFVHPPEHLTFHLLRELEKVDLRPQLSKIYVQTLLLHGSADRICLPSASRYMHEQIASSQLKILGGVGHAPFLERPAEFNAALENFLKGLHG